MTRKRDHDWNSVLLIWKMCIQYRLTQFTKLSGTQNDEDRQAAFNWGERVSVLHWIALHCYGFFYPDSHQRQNVTLSYLTELCKILQGKNWAAVFLIDILFYLSFFIFFALALHLFVCVRAPVCVCVCILWYSYDRMCLINGRCCYSLGKRRKLKI